MVALRALKEAAKTWGDDSEFFLKAAVKFADEFDDWGGFGKLSMEDTRLIDEYRKSADGDESKIGGK